MELLTSIFVGSNRSPHSVSSERLAMFKLSGTTSVSSGDDLITSLTKRYGLSDLFGLSDPNNGPVLEASVSSSAYSANVFTLTVSSIPLRLANELAKFYADLNLDPRQLNLVSEGSGRISAGQIIDLRPRIVHSAPKRSR